ncbi:hypothetical protein V2J09_011367 [Rumex salicifolius]
MSLAHKLIQNAYDFPQPGAEKRRAGKILNRDLLWVSSQFGAMNKPGAGSGGVASGPTTAAAAAAAQKQKTLLQRVEGDVSSLVDNFTNLVNGARVNDPPVRNSQEAFMMEVRAARMVQAADSLLKLVSELKQTAIFSGFASLNDHVDRRIQELNQLADKTENALASMGEEAAASLKELESHLYSSAGRTILPPVDEN